MFKKVLFLLSSVLIFVTALVVVILDPFNKNSRAGLRIEYPSGSALVFLDDTYLGEAPLLEEKLKSGEHIIKITPNDKSLSTLNLPVFLEKGTMTIVVYNPGETLKTSSTTVFELRKREDKNSSVSFETYPENAFISFDDDEVNFSPLIMEDVEAGEHHFLANLPSYEAQDHSFLVLEGYETKISISLAKKLEGSVEEVQVEASPSTSPDEEL